MSNALLVARRELSAYVSSLLGFIVIAAVLLGEGVYFNAMGIGTTAKLSSDVLKEFFNAASGGTMIVAIVLSMRLLAGEREQGTLVLLNTAPIKDSEIVAGKFLAALGLIAAKLALTVHMPLLVAVNGKVSAGHVLVGYAGVLLLGAAALAIGMFGSALAKNQIVAIVIGGVILIVFILLWMVARITDPPLNGFLSSLAIHHERQRPFMNGVLEALERRLLRGRRVLLPPGGHEDAGGTAMAVKSDPPNGRRGVIESNGQIPKVSPENEEDTETAIETPYAREHKTRDDDEPSSSRDRGIGARPSGSEGDDVNDDDTSDDVNDDNEDADPASASASKKAAPAKGAAKKPPRATLRPPPLPTKVPRRPKAPSPAGSSPCTSRRSSSSSSASASSPPTRSSATPSPAPASSAPWRPPCTACARWPPRPPASVAASSASSPS